jgi:gamma-glutamylcyclotransferase (GGCT)/AIG2-like uncharacterized protein YtfP
MQYYFAYGSNMDEKRMRNRGVHFTHKTSGVLKEYQLEFVHFIKSDTQSGFANIVIKDGAQVEGVVYTVDDSVSCLDKYECVPIDYFREELLVQTPKGERQCIVYIGNKANTGELTKPAREYLDHILKGEPFLTDEYFARLAATETTD